MGNKLFYTLAFAGLMTLANLAGPVGAYAPVNFRPAFQPPKERLVGTENLLEKMAKENERKIQNLIEEVNWMENDKVYQEVTRVYASLQVPKYITRKFIRCLGYVESSDNPQNVSEAGAMGWGQFMEDAWYEVEDVKYEKKNLFNLDKNIEATIKYAIFLSKDLRNKNPNWGNLSSEEKVSLIAAAYNGGIGNLTNVNFNVNKMRKETRDYMPRIKRVASEEIAPKVDLFQ